MSVDAGYRHDDRPRVHGCPEGTHLSPTLVRRHHWIDDVDGAVSFIRTPTLDRIFGVQLPTIENGFGRRRDDNGNVGRIAVRRYLMCYSIGIAERIVKTVQIRSIMIDVVNMAHENVEKISHGPSSVFLTNEA